MSAHLRATCAAVLTAALLWLGLSPRVAHYIYTSILMPRCRSTNLDTSTGTADVLVQPVSFASTGVSTLYGHLCTRRDSHKLVVYFGGRRSNHAKNMIRAKALLQAGVSVFIFDYRGFGEAKGRATVGSLLEDGLAAYDAVIALGYSADQIVLYGESLGASVAAYVSSKRKACGLILQSGFSSLEVQIKDMIPPLRVYPGCMFPKLQLSTADSIREKHPPLLILHGDHDRVVDKKHADKLFEVSGPGTRLVVLPGATHLGVQARDDWYLAVREFFSSLDTGIIRQNYAKLESTES